MRTKSMVLLLAIFIIAGCGSKDNSVEAQVQLEQAFPNLTFTRPVDLQVPNDDSNRIFVVEQHGTIYVFDNDSSVSEKSVFLDVQDLVNDQGNEEGLLGLAFHPNFASNGYFYVDYTASNPRRTVIARYSVDSNNSNQADPNSEHILLELEQPYSNHNGGQIAFGPDGYLYIAFGDGGSGGDPHGNGQNRGTLLASIARIDVDNPAGDNNYGIPPDNPFAGNTEGYREEIFAFGLRNPWRFSFDPVTNQLWAGDVGQNLYEEVDIIKSGHNYGWNIMEGLHCYDASSCDTTGLTLPIQEYSHDSQGGQSITGGYVYRGSAVPELRGKYIYGDFVSGRIWSTTYPDEGAVNTLLLESNLNISSFGTDQNNELYLCAFDGKIYKFTPVNTGTSEFGSTSPTGFNLEGNYPNPFNSSTVIMYSLDRPAKVTAKIYNTIGQLVRTMMDKTASPGTKIVQWNGENSLGRDVPSGVYFCQLSLNKRVLGTKKLLLVR